MEEVLSPAPATPAWECKRRGVQAAQHLLRSGIPVWVAFAKSDDPAAGGPFFATAANRREVSRALASGQLCAAPLTLLTQ